MMRTISWKEMFQADGRANVKALKQEQTWYVRTGRSAGMW